MAQAIYRDPISHRTIFFKIILSMNFLANNYISKRSNRRKRKVDLINVEDNSKTKS
jgi:hypothetical protein